MRTLKLSRRRFILSLLASASVLPLSCHPWKVNRGDYVKKATIQRMSEGAIRLNVNENPLGPSPKAIKAMEKAMLTRNANARANPTSV